MGSAFVSDESVIGSSTPGHYGVARTSLVTLQEATIAAAWNLQGDPAKPALVEQVRLSFGTSLPLIPNKTLDTDTLTAVWLGPTSWLLVAGDPLSPTHPLTHFAAKRDAVNAAGGALFDVSTSRVAWTLAGPRAATVLASGCPLDFHRRAFPVESCAQSLFGHVSALFCRRANGDFTMFVARSFARDVWSTLCVASAQHGYDVHTPAPFR
jgi:sarcosine oxidase subunit gamma